MAVTLRELELVRPGDSVCLTDDQTITDMMESGMTAAAEGLELEVERVMHIREQHGLCDWYFCPLKGTCPESYPQLWLLIKTVDDEFDVRIYWLPDGFQVLRTRGDLINDGMLWLFAEPQNEADFLPRELEFTRWIDHDTGSGVAKFNTKIGELHGEYREPHAPTDQVQPQPATVVEYSTSQERVEATEILILELGGLNEFGEQVAEGGMVHFFLGGPVASRDIDLIQRVQGSQ